jgi:hypothetical protein
VTAAAAVAAAALISFPHVQAEGLSPSEDDMLLRHLHRIA